MSGIIFFNTRKLDALRHFYVEQVGCSVWMDQGDCVILRFDNMLFGFCTRNSPDLDGMITFVYITEAEVDRAHARFADTADATPRHNPKYPIYHFFARDPEGRILEFQQFTW